MGANGWVLEIVKGREEGKRYPLRPGEQVLGNALNGSPGLDLADQETSPTRRMSARHASLDISNGNALLRDLETPGGTFVNRQRLLPGQARPLQEGDLIQLAGVQLLFRSSHTQSTTPASVRIPQVGPGRRDRPDPQRRHDLQDLGRGRHAVEPEVGRPP